ncbi:MAG TPA: MarR family transcriptional regulator [Acidimicrobiia bacterium]|nr:MarR family transcriptional regulator [Acidimicrobiia bacterium]
MSREQRQAAVRRLVEALRALQLASDLLDEAYADFVGINRTDLRCMDIVDQRGRVTAGELAREAGLTTGAVTAVVDRMESAGLLLRTYDANDRRKVWIELTPDAEKLGEEVYGPLDQAGQTHLASLGDEQVLTIIGFLEVSRRITMENVEAIRSRTSTKKMPLRYRLEQARMIKDDAKALAKRIKHELKEMKVIVLDLHGSKWEQDEDGRWVERRGLS